MNNTLQSWQVKISLMFPRLGSKNWHESTYIETEILNDIFNINQTLFQNIMKAWEFDISTSFYIKHIFGPEKQGLIQVFFKEEKTSGPYLFKNKLENCIKCLDGVLNYNARHFPYAPRMYTPAPLSSFINSNIIRNVRKNVLYKQNLLKILIVL